MVIKPSKYEQKALDEIRAWKQAEPGRMARVLEAAGRPVRKLTDKIDKTPGLDWAAEKAAGRMVDMTNDLAHRSVRQDRIYEEFATFGYNIQKPGDVVDLDLEVVDKAAAGLRRKYMSLAGVEGAAAGVAGIAGVVADIVGLVGMNQRAAAEYAAYYGFDISDSEERLFAMSLCGYASLTTERDRQRALEELAELGRAASIARTRNKMKNYTYTNIVKRIATSIGWRLGKVKLAQLVPVIGAGVGAGLNVAYTGRVCEAATHLYRERFLIAKYGEQVSGRPDSEAPADIEDLYEDLLEGFEEV